MNKLNIELTNCFGIDSLNHEFDFGKGNTFSIYARNGLMKTSFAKTFQLIQQGKKENISDAIFGEPGSAIVQIDGQDIEKKQVFVVKSYESSYESDISSLLIKGDIQTQLKDALEIDDTPWKKALDIFNQRFTVPFMMNVVNLKGAIIGESVPRVEFSFKKGDTVKTIDRSKLEKLDTLSQGEKRALYLLNIIFDIEQIKNTGEETLLVIDDIADSFDYKNKYAIIEYLYELAQVSNIYMLILTHNFDFYRTVASRLSVNRSNRLIADYSNDVLKLEVEYYQDKPFKNWKNNPKEKDIFALLPFVRNLIEYGVDQNISHTGEDFLFLTSLLHEKQDSRRITFGDIEPLYKHYAGVTQFDASVGTDVVVLSKLYSVCDDITTSDTKLENKIVLSIGIRHKAEEYIIQQIHNYTGQLSWRKNKQNYRGTNVEFMNFVQNNGNQTRELFNGYKQFGDADKIKILNEVNIMTPEHIHVNSFMYEPILDMDIVELHRLYHTIKNLI